jgi:dipeptidyl aminopeptidase/acylaminoacyl peptidase
VGPVIELQSLSLSRTGVVAFVGSEAQRPAEIYVMKSLSAKPRRLTQFNDAIAAFKLGHSETITWQLDGFEHSGVLTFPPDFMPGAKAPLVLHIHGGPQSTSTQAFDYFGQVLAAQGWIVFKPNYRGSNPQGDAYQSAIANDFGAGPGRDIMAGVAAVKARGIVDADRIAVSGWSYGGYLSAWLIGHYQDFRAAVIGAPMTDILSWYNLSCCNAWAAEMAGGSPWVNGNYANYWRQSPVAYADKVKTPTLLLHRTGDPEAPLPESYYFYHALRDNGVTVKFIAYPLAGHGFEYDPVNERDTLRRWMGWIDEQFRAGTLDRR